MSQLSKHCCINVLYKPLENLDAIALDRSLVPLQKDVYQVYSSMGVYAFLSIGVCQYQACQVPKLIPNVVAMIVGALIAKAR
jgi:hypothetical protein